MIYFIGAVALDDGTPVKVGYTTSDPRQRLRALQCGNSTKLEIKGLMPGDRDAERALHRYFAPVHVHGEWFAYPAVMGYLSTAIARGQAYPLMALEYPYIGDCCPSCDAITWPAVPRETPYEPQLICEYECWICARDGSGFPGAAWECSFDPAFARGALGMVAV